MTTNEEQFLELQEAVLEEQQYIDPIGGDPKEAATLLIQSLSVSPAETNSTPAGEAIKKKRWPRAAKLLATLSMRSADQDNDLGVALANVALSGDDASWAEAVSAFDRSEKAAETDLQGRRARQNKSSVLRAKELVDR